MNVRQKPFQVTQSPKRSQAIIWVAVLVVSIDHHPLLDDAIFFRINDKYKILPISPSAITPSTPPDLMIRSNIAIFLYYVIFLSYKYDVICDVILLALTLVITKITSLRQLPNFPPTSKILLKQNIDPTPHPPRQSPIPPCRDLSRGPAREDGNGEAACPAVAAAGARRSKAPRSPTSSRSRLHRPRTP